jgi:hypothetical protein
LCGSVAAARPHPTPTPSPAPVADPAITALAKKQFVAWQAGSINKSAYATEILDQLTDDKVNQTSVALGKLGALTGMTYEGPLTVADLPGGSGYIYHMTCIGGAVYLFMVLDPQGKIEKIFFKDQLTTEAVTASPSPPPQK